MTYLSHITPTLTGWLAEKWTWGQQFSLQILAITCTALARDYYFIIIIIIIIIVSKPIEKTHIAR